MVDLGSGGGVPGLVLASVWPEATLRLVEGSATRAAWLKQYVGDCGWSDRVKVVGERAELAGRYVSLRGQAAAVVARAFGRSSDTAEGGAPFLRQGGALVVSEPPRPPVTPRWPAEGLAELGLRQDLELRLGGFAVFRQCDVCPGRYPRRVGVPRKRPLF
ncbi:MAG: RsmG family class I SAM-dependent methyltransferase [Acidimicrobiales bacterium]